MKNIILTEIEKQRLPVSPVVYASLRRQKGSQAVVAATLGITAGTLSLRERGYSRVTREQVIALLALPDAPAPDLQMSLAIGGDS